MQPFNDEVDKILEQYGLDEPGYAMVASDLADLMDKKEDELKRLQNENMCLREDNDRLVVRIEQLKAELKLNNLLKNEAPLTYQIVASEIIEAAMNFLHLAKHGYELEIKCKNLQSDLNGKNFLLDKALIDNAILVQEITYLKEGKQHEKQSR